jgi:hypothetical protein
MWDFADAPLMYQAMFGHARQLCQDGVQLKWLAPTPMFLEFGAEAGRGANYPGTERNKNGVGAWALLRISAMTWVSPIAGGPAFPT